MSEMMQIHKKGVFAYDNHTEICPGSVFGRGLAAESE
jgi:hypothetical protein